MISYCRKCIHYDNERYFNRLQIYIENIDVSDRVSEDTYKQRLDICCKCANIMNGMCRLCGCFVELRAAMFVQFCPDNPAKW